MAYAMVNGRKYQVRVTPDLTENFAVEVYPAPVPGAVKIAEPYKPWPVPLTIKLRADSAADALLHGLAHMKKLGKISDFHLDEHEKPKPPEPKPAAAPAAAPTAAKPAAPAAKSADPAAAPAPAKSAEAVTPVAPAAASANPKPDAAS